ncbi:hypothetical protein [Brevibacillus choshinensis]|uniref:hypothetical protein n=1 Tax=Brevibacillus choshinensis TaxID=54911 RepID=UPI002E1ED86F|nr:hypothetical protein [Brevibacillus choshinensis]
MKKLFSVIAYLIGIIWLVLYVKDAFGPPSESEKYMLHLGTTWLHVIVLPAIISYLCLVTAITAKKRIVKRIFFISSLIVAVYVLCVI